MDQFSTIQPMVLKRNLLFPKGNAFCQKLAWCCLLVLLWVPFESKAQLSISCVPGFPISCASDIIVDTNAPFVFTNCGQGSGTTVSVSGPEVNGANGCPGTTYTYTYTATDFCNETASCTQVFTIANNIGPGITQCPQAKTVNCAYNVMPEPHLVLAESPCGITSEISVSGPEVIGEPNCPSTQYVYTYTATDECGQTVSCLQYYTIQNEGPEFICAPEVCIVNCNTPVEQIQATFDAFAQQATVLSSCSNLETVVTNNFNPNAIGSCQSQQVVTFTATDPCGRAAFCTALVVVVDQVGPTIEGEPYLTIRECDDNVQNEYDAWVADNIANMNASDNCGAVTWSHTPASPNEVCNALGYAVTHVIFTATDECGNTASKDVHFKLKNKFPPSWSGDLADINIKCDEALPPFDTPEYYHACGNTVLSSVDTTISGACPGEYSLTRTWTVTDGCGQSNTTSQTIFVIDTTAPAAPPAAVDITIECADDIPAPSILIATDNCSGNISVLPTEETIPGACPNQFTLIRTWTFEDGCGNVSTSTRMITIKDTKAPNPPLAPAGITVSCANEVPAPEALTATDNCDGNITVDPEIEIIPQNCPNKFTEIRRWTFVDACGNASNTISQTIIINDLTPPDPVNVPNDKTISCEEPIAFGPEPEWIDNCGGMIGLMSFEDATTPGSCPNEYSVTRTWSVVDDCGILGTASQTITVIDETDPVFTFVPTTQTISCGGSANFETPIAADNCGAVNLTFEDSQTSGNVCEDGYTHTRLWTATDECGNTAQVSTMIVFLPDNEAPIFTFVPETPDVGCGNIPDFIEPIATDNCGEIELTFTEYQSPGTICDGGFAKKRLWTATDECGNSAEVETVIWVNPDVDAPVFTFVPEGELIDCDQFPPSFGTPEVTDDCGATSLTFEDEYVTGGPNSCANGESFDYRRIWTATDDCGNVSTAKQTFWVKPTQSVTGIVSGHLFDENNEMIGNAEVRIEGGTQGIVNSMITDVEGAFDFELPMDLNYTISPERNDDPLNGVSTLDLILMSKHILGMKLLDSPYKMIAADINKSGSITAYDLVELQKMILHINTEFTDNQSWRFVDESFVFPDPTHPFGSTFPEQYNINGLSSAEIANFIGIKIGDVNGNAVPNELLGNDTRDELTPLFFEVEDRELLAGESYTIDFKAKDFKQILGYQFTLEFDERKVGLMDLYTDGIKGLDIHNFSLSKLAEGHLTSSWYQEEGLTIEDGATLFQINIKAAEDTRLSDVLQLNSTYTNSEAYSEIDDLLDLNLNFYEVDAGELKYNFTLLQNYPNPFQKTTNVRFLLPESSSATLTVYDLSGQVLQVITADYEKGYNEIPLSRNDFIGSGIFYYRLDTPTRNAMKRMIMLHD